MPKVNANLAEISTSFEPVEPGVYEFLIKDIEIEELDAEGGKKKGKRQVYIFKNKIDQPDSEENGREIWDRIHIHKKDGTINEFGLVQLKRYFEAVLGEGNADRDDLDTDEIKNGRFQAEVAIETYTKNGEEIPTNRLKNIVSL